MMSTRKGNSNESGSSGTGYGSLTESGSDDDFVGHRKSIEKSWDVSKREKGVAQRKSPKRVESISKKMLDRELDAKYDLTPVSQSNKQFHSQSQPFPVDPWEDAMIEQERIEAEQLAAAPPSSPIRQEPLSKIGLSEEEENSIFSQNHDVFLVPSDIHPNMEHKDEEVDRLRLLAGKLSAEWKASENMAAPALARRIRDFQFAQEKRRKKYGDERPWGVLGLYDFLSSIRTDVEWAEDAAKRRANGEPYNSWADFEESKRMGYNRPFFTYFLLFVCTVDLVASFAVNGWKVEPLAINPMIGPSAETLIRMGAKQSYLIVVMHQGWRLLSSTILHAGLVHYFVNVLALWFVGVAIETSHGWVAAMIIFNVSAVGGTILSAIFLPDYITVGASGGIFGFIGACLADIIMNWKLLFCDCVTENGKKQSHLMVVFILIFDIVLNSIIGLTPFVDNFTHLGGMTYGFLCGLSTMERLSTDFFGMEEPWATKAKHFCLRFFGVILSLVAIVVTLIVLLRGDGETVPCTKCSSLSCVPFPPWGPADHKWWYCDDCGRVTADFFANPNPHLELVCPNDIVSVIDLTNATNLSRDFLQKKLPTFCREFCADTQQRL